MGKPSEAMRTQTSASNTIYDGLFIQSSTSLADEIEADVVLNWLFKEDSPNEEVRHHEISSNQYGRGYKMIQRMGYLGTGPLGKQKEGITEPIQLQTKSTHDKAGLRYNPKKTSEQKHVSKSKGLKKILPLTLHEANTKQMKEECRKEKEESTVKKEEIVSAQASTVSAMIIQEVEVPEDIRDEFVRIKELFSPLKVPVTYTGRQQVDDLETDSNKYEWGPDYLSDTSAIETPKESGGVIDDTQELMRIKLEREIQEIRQKRQATYEQALKEGTIPESFSSMCPYPKIEQISYSTTQEELEVVEQEPVISLEEAEWSI